MEWTVILLEAEVMIMVPIVDRQHFLQALRNLEGQLGRNMNLVFLEGCARN